MTPEIQTAIQNVHNWIDQEYDRIMDDRRRWYYSPALGFYLRPPKEPTTLFEALWAMKGFELHMPDHFILVTPFDV